jgi:tetratricopeptide (TPR) repeat protein
VEAADALDLGVALRPYSEAHGTLPDELRLLEQAVSNCPNDEPSLHAGLNLLAQLTLTAGNTEQARGYAQRALLEADDQPVRRAAALVILARVNWERDQHDDAVIGSLDEALALAAKSAVAEVEADALRVKAAVALKHGSEHADYLAANALFERAEALYRQVGGPDGRIGSCRRVAAA